MIAAGLLALTLAGPPALLPVSERRATYYVRRKRRTIAEPPAAAPPAVEAPAPRAVRTIPIIEWDAFYRRVGL
jgi:hypothetical protein